MPVLHKINQLRRHIHSTELKKTGYNKFSQYSYFELADFLIPALSKCIELDLCTMVSFATDLASMTVTDLEDGTSFVITSPMSTAALKACHEVQNLGAVQTYLRRYLWVALLEIVEHDAVDSSAGPDKKAKKDAGGVITGTNGALDAMTEDERNYMRELALEFIDSKDFRAIVDRLEAENLENEQKVALWSLLPSNIRSGIKKEQEARKVQA